MNIRRTLLAIVLMTLASSAYSQVKLIDSFDSECWKPVFGVSGNCSGTVLKYGIDNDVKIEGEGSFRLDYSFSGCTGSSAGEYVYVQRLFANFRPDLSFHPKHLSLWVKGNPANKGNLRVVLLQGNMAAKGYRRVLKTYQYTDSESVRSDSWTCVEIPYEKFSLLDAQEGTSASPEDPGLDLMNVIGWRIDIVNSDSSASEGNRIYLDKMEQVTSYEPQWNPKARFSSLFIQLNASYAATDWDEVFESAKKLGIDTWIIQFCIGRKAAWTTSYYKDCSLPWITKKLDIIDRMYEAASRCGVKFIMGSSYQSWNTKLLWNPEHYDEVFELNRQVIEDVARNFCSSEAFAGWYIANEFHDGVNFSPNWFEEECNSALAAYLEKTASYMKSFKNVPVCVAPALFRGRPAKLTGELYDRLFARTPSVDILYLQDCAGRGPDMVTSVTVDLPNYFAEIKKACDRNGVTFGVDIESFFRFDLRKQPRRPKTWEELRSQLQMAGNFTDHITNFSWFSFQPGHETWDGYKDYCSSEGL